jgi:hypothetical protein
MSFLIALFKLKQDHDFIFLSLHLGSHLFLTPSLWNISLAANHHDPIPYPIFFFKYS